MVVLFSSKYTKPTVAYSVPHLRYGTPVANRCWFTTVFVLLGILEDIGT